MGMTDDEVDSVLSLVSGILLLGNVGITGRERGGIPNAAAIEGSDAVVFKVRSADAQSPERSAELACASVAPESSRSRVIVKDPVRSRSAVWFRCGAHLSKTTVVSRVYTEGASWKCLVSSTDRVGCLQLLWKEPAFRLDNGAGSRHRGCVDSILL